MSHPRKTPKNGKKTSIFNTFQTMPDTPKTNLFNIKTSKSQTPKTPFCHVQKQPTIFHQCSVFQHTVFVFESCVLLKTLLKECFQETQLFKNTVSKAHFFNHVKNTVFPKKGVIFAFLQFPLKPLFL